MTSDERNKQSENLTQIIAELESDQIEETVDVLLRNNRYGRSTWLRRETEKVVRASWPNGEVAAIAAGADLVQTKSAEYDLLEL